MPGRLIEIIHQTPEMLVINKPAGISVTADRSGADDILTVLGRQLPAGVQLRLVHRLDKFTSGAMIIAKTPQAQSTYSSWFAKRRIKKIYLALATGIIDKATGTIDAPIARSRRDPRMMLTDHKRGKPAITHYQLLADFGTVSLLAVRPETGRTHQIRVHLAASGMPLAVDPLYGAAAPIMLSDIKDGYRLKPGRVESPLIDRLTLHAYQLEVAAPDAEPVVFVAPLEKKFAAAVKMAAKHNPKGPNAFTNPDNLQRILNARPL